ncbi:MAG: D-tyrosyl-tRNA(Tyr) deacylase [Candidatus Omnitrophica bacterium]|nr:D-tyrosyl-tRNA(Tyr) deacylase [Candidatus Omnitrophota bacterium]
MKAVIQRVKEARVVVAGEVIGRIGRGVLVFLGVEQKDTSVEVEALVKKISQLRIFPSPQGGRMDLANFEVDGEYLVVSQFTLVADLGKGNRPSFDNAAPPEEAEKLYNHFVEQLKKGPCRVATGKFRAMMDVVLVNDGPVTFIL